MGTEKRYQWKRFWCPKEGSYALDERGYLLDPKSEYSKYYQTDAVDWDALANTSCLALLGEPGIGKTHALEDFKSQRETQTYSEGDLLCLSLRDYGSDERLYKAIFESEEFNNWINSTKILEIVLDSLDECLIHVKTVAPMLITEFKKYPVSRLRLRIACRTSEWPALLHQELPRIWGADYYREYELAPLRRDDVALAARDEGLDAGAFLKTIEERDLVPFAIKPITLVMLLQQYKRPESLGGSIVELYHSYCLYLCQETSVFRRDVGVKGLLEPPLRLAIAKRIAAITMFCKRASIYKGLNEPEAEDVTLSDMAGGTESINGATVPVTEPALRDVLRTGLFAGGIGERHVWRHWTYAEFLAARYLIRHKLSIDQIGDLVFSRQELDEKDSRVIPQLKETAAWLAAMHAPLFKEIAESDPQILLRSFVAGTDVSLLRELTGSLLQMAAKEQIIDFDLRQNYKVLKHPGLADQLRPYITDLRKGFLVRRMAIDIAEACQVQELVEDLVGVALDSRENVNERYQAAYAVAQIGDANAKVRLYPLLDAGDIDADDQLKGCALKALWPNHITAEELFLHITKPKRENLFGTYKLFLMQELMPYLKASDLPVALSWVQRQPKSEAYEIGILQDFTANILEMAWNNLDEGEILEGFAEITIKRIENYEPIFGERVGRKKPGINLDDTVKRQRLIKAILPKLAESQIKTVWQHLPVGGLVTRSDFSWLMKQIWTSESQTYRVLWAKLVLMIFDWNPQELEELWNAKESIPSLKEIFAPLFSPIALDSDTARQLRKIQKWRIQAERGQDKKSPRPSLRSILDKRLNKFESGDIDSWWILTLEMTCEAREGKYIYGDELQSDLTSSPGWNTIDEPTRLRVVQAAYAYVLRGDPHTDDWFGKNIFHRPAAAGYKALLLLQKLSPQCLKELSDSVWEKWAPIVLSYPDSPVADAKEPKENLVTLTYQHVPSSVIKVLLALIDKDNEDHGNIFVLRKMDETWDSVLEDAILEKAKDAKLKPTAAGDLIGKLFEKGQSIDKIRRICVDFLAERNMSEGLRHEKAIYCGALLLIYGGEEGWEIIQKILDNEPDFGCKLIAQVARGHDHAGIIVRSLSERSVADLYIWVAEKFPYSEDPKIEGAHSVDTRERIAHFRDAILQGLRERGTPEAVAAIREIAKCLPHLSWIKFTAHEARQIAMRKIWRGSSPKEILNLVQSNDNRLVDSEEQLLEVLIASLKQYQRLLLGEKPAVYDLWNTNDWTPKEETFISDHVARHLESDLKNRGVVVNREVQIRRGQETDIHIVAIAEKRDGSIDQVRVITEVKGCWNPEVKSAMQAQLRDRYLRENQCGHGLYLVAWFLCDKWRDESRKKKTPQWTLEEAQRFFEHQASDLSMPGEILRAVVLDTRLR
jgi:hypothetical protein